MSGRNQIKNNENKNVSKLTQPQPNRTADHSKRKRPPAPGSPPPVQVLRQHRVTARLVAATTRRTPTPHVTSVLLLAGDCMQCMKSRKFSTSTASKLAIQKCITFRYNAMIARRGVLIRVLYGCYQNKRNSSRLGSEASVTCNILQFHEINT